MKNLLIAILVIIILGFGAWKLLETKPDVNVPVATVTDTINTTPTTATQTPSDTSTTSTTVTTTTTTTTSKQIDNGKVAIAFTGFGPGKKHIGSFSDIKSKLDLNDKGDMSGSITVGMASLNTDTEAVTKHLKTDAFFDVVKYPTATFTVTEDLTASTCKGDTVRCKAPYLYGNFTIHGVTKGVSFPVVRSADKYTATFNINMKEFGISQTLTNEVVELSVTAPLK